jgi:hypothetical protein
VTREYGDDIKLMRHSDPILAGELEKLVSLQGVFDWMKRRNLPLSSIDVVTQDEYSHDFLVPLGLDGRCLAFGIT